jgi:valyl-tRNA synthetase
MSATDRWILSRLNKTVAEVDALYDDFQFAKLSDALYHFAWDEVFDWYVELSKTTFMAGGEPAEVSKRVLGEVLDVTLRLLHPVVPFVTETLWTTLTGGESVVIADWPKDSGFRDTGRRAEIETLQQVITEVRRFRADQGLQPGQRSRPGSPSTAPPGPHEAAIRQLLRLQPEGDAFAATATLPVAAPRSPSTSPARSTSRRSGSASRRTWPPPRRRRPRRTAKLGNEAFLAKAPDNVVDKIRGRLPRPTRTSPASRPSWTACRRRNRLRRRVRCTWRGPRDLVPGPRGPSAPCVRRVRARGAGNCATSPHRARRRKPPHRARRRKCE